LRTACQDLAGRRALVGFPTDRLFSRQTVGPRFTGLRIVPIDSFYLPGGRDALGAAAYDQSMARRSGLQQLPFNGEALRRLRDAARWDQRELANKAGLGVPTISSLETGRTTDPHASTVRSLARALGVDPRVLLEPNLYKEQLNAVARRAQSERRREEEELQTRADEARALEPQIAEELRRLGVAATTRGGVRVFVAHWSGEVMLESARSVYGWAPAPAVLQLLQQTDDRLARQTILRRLRAGMERL
jgi:transcriptional regulator with XRE-family HTH domain